MIGKKKLVDIVGEKKAYDILEHTHNTPLETLDCKKCGYEKREAWLDAVIKNSDNNEEKTYKDENGNDKTVTMSKFIVIRGKHDDVIGVAKEWL